MNQNNKFDSALSSIAAEQPLSLKIKGSCMLPLIWDNDVIKVQKKRRYWPGEIITFRMKWGELATHRLIGFYPRNGTTYYLTQADNTTWPDGAITDKQILGKVVGGDCSTEAVNIPLKHRLRTIGQFTRFLACRLFTLNKHLK